MSSPPLLISHTTKILPINPSQIGHITTSTLTPHSPFLSNWTLHLSPTSPSATHLLSAASHLRGTNIPIAFPTETVYGLGADATRAEAVRGIYVAKGRPADNPLIVHVCSLAQLRGLLRPVSFSSQVEEADDDNVDRIPAIYHPLIQRFWPGPLTIILPLPSPSPFAPEVTASLSTFGARMPSSLLALALIHLAQTPLAAPSANSSTKPSPTTAAHVMHDLSGRIELIIDGGPCEIGIESTVVDGLGRRPLVLRPGGVSMEQLRECPGWEGVAIGYRNGVEEGVPRAPGMKYRHYSPDAKVVLVEGALHLGLVRRYTEDWQSIGILRTKKWGENDLWDELMGNGENPPGFHEREKTLLTNNSYPKHETLSHNNNNPQHASLLIPTLPPNLTAHHSQLNLSTNLDGGLTDIWTIGLGPDTTIIARGLFSALRELDLRGVWTIYVESIIDTEGGDIAAAVMNRLRKAAEVEIKL